MNSKERVRNAVELKPVDKIPFGPYLIDYDTIEKIIGRKTYVRNKHAFYTAIWEGRRDEVVESMKSDVVDLYTKLECVDLIIFKECQNIPPRGYVPEDPPKKVDDSTYADSLGNVYRFSAETNGITQVAWAKERGEPPLPGKPDESVFEVFDHLVEAFKDERYIAGFTGGTTAVTLIGGMEEGMMKLALEPEAVKDFNRRQVALQNGLDRHYIRKGVDGAFMEKDFCGTEAPLISPGMFRELALPYLKERIENVKKYAPHVLFHSCGNTMPLMDMLLEAGIDAYESIQTNARDISIKSLADKYGDRLCIWGAVPLEALVSGEPEDARRAVRENIRDAENAGGYILGPSHSIAYGTKYDNFMAMLDEFEKLRDRQS